MKIKLFLLSLLLFIAIGVRARNPEAKIKISLDFESAQVISGLLAGKHVTPVQINHAAEVYGSQQLIRKVKGYSGFGEDVFKSTLKEVVETGTIKGNDPYNWKLVKANLSGIQKLIAKIAANPYAFIADITGIIQLYTSPEITADVRACFLVGGGSLGFTIGNDNTFNVALQKIGNDYEGLKYLVAHELYHSMQAVGLNLRKKKKVDVPYYAQASYGLLYNLWSEGTANLVGDFGLIKVPGPFTKIQNEEFKKNDDRKRENFALFEALLYKAYNDTASRKYETFYNIAFSTAYDETTYFMGYEMAKKIEKYDGHKALADLLVKDLLVFSEEYIKLYKAHKDDESFIHFDPSTELIIKKLAVWRENI